MRTRWARWEVMWRVGWGRSSGMRGMFLLIQRVGMWLNRTISPGSSPAPLNFPAKSINWKEEVSSGSEWSDPRMDCRWGDWSSWHSFCKTCQFGHALAHSHPLNSLQWMVMDSYSRDNTALERNSPSTSSPGETLGAISMSAIIPTENSAAIVIEISVTAPSALMGICPIDRTTPRIPRTKPGTLMPC